MGAGRGAATPEDCCDPPQAHQRPRPFQQDEPQLPGYDRHDGQRRGAQEVCNLVGELRGIHEAELAGGVGSEYRQRSQNRYQLQLVAPVSLLVEFTRKTTSARTLPGIPAFGGLRSLP
jgi:hypothetical protein